MTEKFWNKIQIKNECWNWTGCRTRGYGETTLMGKKIRLHRWSYEYFVGKIPKGRHVLHSCDNPSCLNPFHLFIGDHGDNMKDMVSKGRHHNQVKTHCPNGHEYTEENIQRDGTRRRCKKCKSAIAKAYREKLAKLRDESGHGLRS